MLQNTKLHFPSFSFITAHLHFGHNFTLVNSF